MGQSVLDSEFRWDKFPRLPIPEQVRKCHAMAMEAKAQAAVADRDTREVYALLAEQWSDLAHEIQKSERVSS